MGHTHLIFGADCYLAVALAVPGDAGTALAWLAAGTGTAAAAALVPDIDTRRSMAANSLGYVTRAAGWVVDKIGGGHRGITHRWLGGFALWTAGAAIAWYFLALPRWVPLALVVGYASHLALDDATTAAGIRSGKRKRRHRAPWQPRYYWSAELHVIRPACWLALLALAGVTVATSPLPWHI
jgi:membrane-bound metal-dependent hydrolase YbcI (DUF457 family)